MFAVINTNGVQFVVTRGERIKIQANLGEKGKEVEFDKVMMIKDDGDTVVGRPFVKGAKVKGVIKECGRLPKIVVFKFIRKEKYRRKHGHRQDFCEVEITDIIK
ncbi:MAG: 50S ribosomal protein L21 [candidate division WOR-3 bacterium]|nr:MAG: 50S ribosomal protein L21 [candidate division WOR-3 bacterium]